MLDEGDAEFLLRRAANGKLKIRVGQVWSIPKRRGQTPLLLDLDGAKSINRRAVRKRLFKAGVRPISILSRISPGGNGVHAVIYVEGTFSRIERIALQSILESDPEREAQNFRRAKQAGKKLWEDNWNVLFKGKK